MSATASNFSDVFNDDLLTSSLFLELETANSSPLTTGEESPVPMYDFGVPLKYEEPVYVVPASPDYTRPSSPTSSVGSDENQRWAPAQRWPSSLANSNLSEEEKEKIRREKKREADRKCRKRKKERTMEMENKLRRLEEEKVVMIHKIDSLQRTASAVVGEEEGAEDVATKAVNLFNLNLVECATFIRAHHSNDCDVMSPSSFASGQDAVVKFWMDMKQKFPHSKLEVVSTESEGGGKFHVSWKITGVLANGAALSLNGNTFISVKGGLVIKIVSMWDASSVLAQQFGMTHEEFVKKSETASYFEDFLI
ncbi:hypothetical protein TrRE_jg5731 [Triparma retinervis]|uniref:BZIP domain-containing protein n=1 Tax=Triparma retinervis TaxID=2557542 RepID=A0A9W7AGC5_9STRA|nr:hypothetical protein TrRE_jg5731 [Triparma retinervis]